MTPLAAKALICICTGGSVIATMPAVHKIRTTMHSGRAALHRAAAPVPCEPEGQVIPSVDLMPSAVAIGGPAGADWLDQLANADDRVTSGGSGGGFVLPPFSPGGLGDGGEGGGFIPGGSGSGGGGGGGGPGSGGGITPPEPGTPSAVPEPETWGLLTVAFVLIGTAARRERRASGEPRL